MYINICRLFNKCCNENPYLCRFRVSGSCKKKKKYPIKPSINLIGKKKKKKIFWRGGDRRGVFEQPQVFAGVQAGTCADALLRLSD